MVDPLPPAAVAQRGVPRSISTRPLLPVGPTRTLAAPLVGARRPSPLETRLRANARSRCGGMSERGTDECRSAGESRVHLRKDALVPEPPTLTLLAAAAVALVAMPGPNLVYIATRTLAQGRRGGFASALGVEAGTLVHVMAAAAAASAVIAAVGRRPPRRPTSGDSCDATHGACVSPPSAAKPSARSALRWLRSRPCRRSPLRLRPRC